MTPLNFMPTAPPSRPVAPAGGGAADTPAPSSFESALQRAGADYDTPRADAHADEKPAAGQTSDKPATRAAARRKPSQDDKAQTAEVDEPSDADAPAVTPTRTRGTS